MYLRPPYGLMAEGSGALCDHAAGILGCGYPGLEIKKCPFCGKYRKKTSEGWLKYLMHDSFSTSVEAALEIADMLTEEGYDLVTADQLLVM